MATFPKRPAPSTLRGRARLDLMLGVSILAFGLGAAESRAQGCGEPREGRVTCRGELPGGVVLSPARDVTLTLSPDVRAAGVVQLGALRVTNGGRNRAWEGAGRLILQAEAGSAVGGGREGLVVLSGGAATISAQGDVRDVDAGARAWAADDVRVDVGGRVSARDLGVHAVSFGGDVLVFNAGTIEVASTARAGILIEGQPQDWEDSGGRIEARNTGRIMAGGEFSAGMAAVQGRLKADVIVANAGEIVAGAVGVYANGVPGGVTTIENSGRVETLSAGGRALVAESLFGDIRITNTGSLTSRGADGAGVTVIGDIYNAELVAWRSFTVVNTGQVETTGARAIGIGVDAQFGDLAVETTGAIVTHGAAAHGVQIDGRVRLPVSPPQPPADDAELASAAARLKVGGRIAADQGWAAVVYASTADVTVDAGAVVQGGAGGLRVRTRDGARMTIGGGVRSPGGHAVSTDGGPLTLTITSGGRVFGGLRTGAAADAVMNGGVLTLGHSDFGAGKDKLVNTGVIRLEQLHVGVVGLEDLENRGLIDLRDGAAGGRLDLTGARLASAEGGRLGIDLGRDATGRLAGDEVRVGTLTGTTLVSFAGGPDLAFGSSTTFLRTSTPPSAGALVVDPAAGRGLYGFAIAADDGGARVTVGPGASAFGAVGLSRAAVRAWSDITSALGNHMQMEADAALSEDRMRGWLTVEATDRRTGHETYQAQAGGSDFFMQGRTRETGEAVLGGLEVRQGDWTVGVDALHRRARGDFDGRLVETRLNATGAGAYAHWSRGRAHVALQAQALVLDGRARMHEEDLAPTTDGAMAGVEARAGYRFSRANLYVQPHLAVSWAYAELDDLRAGAVVLEPGDDAWTSATLGARFGGVWAQPRNGLLDLSVGLAAKQSFGVRRAMALRSDDASVSLRGPKLGTEAVADFRLNYSGGGPLSAQVAVQHSSGEGKMGWGTLARAGVRYSW